MNRIKLLGWKAGINSTEEAITLAFNKIRENSTALLIKEALGTVDDIKKDYLKLKELNSLELETDSGDILHKQMGFRVANYFFPHRLYLSATDFVSVADNLEDDSKLQRLISKELLAGSVLTAPRLITIAGNLLSGYQLGNFCPPIAKYIYEKFAPYKEGKILDMSAGFGGRLVAALSSKYKYDYTGVDPSSEAVAGLNKLASFLKAENRVRIIQKPFEETDADLENNSFDIAFTSPPYFKKEKYSEEETQSWKRYPEYESWLSGFLYPLVSISEKKLKHGRYLIINVENVLVKGKNYPVEGDVVKIAKTVGLEYLGKKNMIMSSRAWIKGRDTFRRESVFIFKKA